MPLLSFYSQDRDCSVALKVKDQIYQDTVLLSSNTTQAKVFIPLIQKVWDQAGKPVPSVLMTARGPGAFTSLRVTLAAAQGLSLAFDRARLFAPTHFDVLYDAGRQQTPAPLLVLIDSKRGDWYGRIYKENSLSQPFLTTETQIFQKENLKDFLKDHSEYKIIADFEMDETFAPFIISRPVNLALHQLNLYENPLLQSLWEKQPDYQTFEPFYFYDPVYAKKIK